MYLVVESPTQYDPPLNNATDSKGAMRDDAFVISELARKRSCILDLNAHNGLTRYVQAYEQQVSTL